MNNTTLLTQEEFWDISAHICNTSALNRDEKSVASWTLGEVWKELKERGFTQIPPQEETKEN